MRIEGADWNLLARLLSKAQHASLTRQEETELRSILARQSPLAYTMPFHELTHLGAVLFGLHEIYEGR